MNNFIIPGSTFYASEILPPGIINNPLLNPSWYIDRRVIKLLDFQKKRYNKMIVANNWSAGGQYENRGVRIPGCPEGNPFDMHYHLIAIDYDVIGMTAEEVRQDIRDNYQDIYKDLGLTRIEINIPWNHNDFAVIFDDLKQPFEFSK